MPKRTIYLMKNHALLKMKDGSFVCQYLKDNETTKETYPIENVDKVVIYGNIQVTTQAMSLGAKYKIMFYFYDQYGNFKYSMHPKENNVGKYRDEQYKAYFDIERRLNLSKKIIESASINKVILLRRYHEKNEDIKESADKIEGYIAKIKNVLTIDELRGYEAIITKEYYSNFDKILNNYDFGKRVRQKPNNEINTMLSFGNMLLYHEIDSKIYEVGLCPFRGFIHEIQDRKPSLALDISEVFKQPIIDSMIFDLVNNKRINDSCFNKSDRICMLNNLGKKILITKFENKMMTTFFHKTLKQHKSYRDCFRLEIYKICKYLNQEDDYNGFRIY